MEIYYRYFSIPSDNSDVPSSFPFFPLHVAKAYCMNFHNNTTLAAASALSHHLITAFNQLASSLCTYSTSAFYFLPLFLSFSTFFSQFFLFLVCFVSLLLSSEKRKKDARESLALVKAIINGWRKWRFIEQRGLFIYRRTQQTPIEKERKEK